MTRRTTPTRAEYQDSQSQYWTDARASQEAMIARLNAAREQLLASDDSDIRASVSGQWDEANGTMR